MFEDRVETDARFERAVIEALHAGESYVREEAATLPPLEPTARRVAESAHDAAKWRIVARAARGW